MLLAADQMRHVGRNVPGQRAPVLEDPIPNLLRGAFIAEGAGDGYSEVCERLPAASYCWTCIVVGGGGSGRTAAAAVVPHL